MNKFSLIAQLAECWTVNPRVVGSSPTQGATFKIKGLIMKNYVIIDEYNFFVWDNVEAESPEDAAKIVDEKVGNYGHEYYLSTVFDGNYCFHVSEMPSDWVSITDCSGDYEIEKVFNLPHRAFVYVYRKVIK